LSLLFGPEAGLDAGAGAGAAGVEAAAVLLVESPAFGVSLLSDGFDSPEDSELPSELFDA